MWFNVGVEPKPQCSACFILSVDDTMDSILDWYRKEGVIFKGGSGSGVNLSRLRSSKERLGGGGTASGPVSFMRAADASAGVIKSGGKTRRAAKMVVLNVDHPDIVDFIRCKAEEEKKAWALIAAGYDGSLDGPAYGSVFFQNANNSVRVTDEFMRAALEGRPWSTRFVTSGEPCETLPARDMLRMIAEATHQCGDPGMQFDTTINDWHTCPNTGRINASNPCSRVHAPRRQRLQSREPEPDAVRRRATATFDVDRVPPRRRHRDHRAGHRRRQLELSDAGDHGERARLSASSGSATRTWARCSCRSACRTTPRRGASTPARSRPSCAARPTCSRRASPGAWAPYEGYATNREPQLRVIDKHRAHAHKLEPDARAARSAGGGARRVGRRRSATAASTACATRR